MAMTDGQNFAFKEVERKVHELQTAIANLAYVCETNSFGLEEWSESLEEDLSDLEADLDE